MNRLRPGIDHVANELTDPAANHEPSTLDVGPRTVPITHPERVIWPLTGTTKRDLISYLLAVAPVLLPHLRDRATMLWRFPEGIDGPGWFQAQCRGRPPWVPTHEIEGRRGELLRYCVIDEPATLAWLANQGTIEFHPHGWTIDRPLEPSAVIFDLDPGQPAGIVEAARVALLVAARLRSIGLVPIVKTSGRLGLHVAAPLEPGQDFDQAKAFCRSVASDLAAADPDLVVAGSARPDRAGRVYIDWVQNDRARQLAAPYSPRAAPMPQVSTPLTWTEVDRLAAGDLRGVSTSFDGVLARIERLGDLWATDPEAAGRLPGV